jgi:hypothetical protein
MNNISIHKENDNTNVKLNNTLQFDNDTNISVKRMDTNLNRTSSSGKPRLVPMDDIGLMANPRKSSDRSEESETSEKLHTNTYDYNFSDGNNNDNGNDSSNMNTFEMDDADNERNSSNGSMSSVESFHEPRREKTYEEIQQEKHELLFKLSRLEKSGYNSSRRYTMASPLEDIQYEYSKVKRQRDVDKSVKFQRKMLMAFASGVEFLNGRFDPLDLKLDGWSESCMENISDYDEVFEELHDKYADKVQMAPELKLLMMVGGSAFMFHMTNTLFKSSMPGMGDILKNNPEIMRNISQAAMNSMGENLGEDRDDIMNMMRSGINMKADRMSARQSRQSQQSQQNMSGPRGVDDILGQLNSAQLGSDTEGELDERSVSLGTRRKKRGKKSNNAINISLN